MKGLKLAECDPNLLSELFAFGIFLGFILGIVFGTPTYSDEEDNDEF